MKTKHIETSVCVCVCELEHINTIYLTQDLNNINRSLLVEFYLQVDSIQTRSNELDSNRVLDVILMCKLLN